MTTARGAGVARSRAAEAAAASAWRPGVQGSPAQNRPDMYERAERACQSNLPISARPLGGVGEAGGGGCDDRIASCGDDSPETRFEKRYNSENYFRADSNPKGSPLRPCLCGGAGKVVRTGVARPGPGRGAGGSARAAPQQAGRRGGGWARGEPAAAGPQRSRGRRRGGRRPAPASRPG